MTQPHMFQTLHVLSQPLLSLTELATAAVVSTKVGHDRVYNEQLERLLHHNGAKAVQEILLLVKGAGAGTEHVLRNGLRVHSKPACNGCQSVRAECAFSVNVRNLACAAALFHRQLCCHTGSSAQLALSSAVLSI